MKSSSRREFLEQLIYAPLLAGAGLATVRGAAWMPGAYAILQAPGEAQFPNPHFIRYDANCFTINDRDVFVYSASFHYTRTPKALWHDRLLKLKLAGFNAIETYVFWNYHEPVEGHADMTELEDFIKQVHAMGMWLIIRVGPYACAEWDAGGFPHWILAEQFPLRGDSPQSVQTSKHWYDLVLPVVQRSTIEVSGPTVMIQVENEYDYWHLPNAQKLAYVTALAEMVWNAGIDIPIITNWVKQARENSNPVMARIMDTCDFYPRWDIVKDVVPALAKLRREEPSSPVSIAELQGGWFSQIGGKLSVDQEGIGGDQLNMITKTAIEQGTTYLNFYMGYGGTNFDWAARDLTTTYDYAAPVREPGGLWEKYYAARSIGAFLDKFGVLMTRAEQLVGSIQTTNPSVSITERVNGKSGFLFIRENANAPQQFKMTFSDSNSPTHRLITVPREGELAIGARGMKMLAVQVPVPGGQIRYSTAEILSYGYNPDRGYLLVYDEPGSLVEIAVATEKEPHVEGQATYQYYDPEYESVIIGFHLDQPMKMFQVNDSLQIVALHRQTAMRTWTAQFPASVIPQTSSKNPMDCPFITDCALMTNTASERNTAWVDMEFAPGAHEVVTFLPVTPDKCTVDGAAVSVQRDPDWRTTRFHIATPPMPFQSVNLTNVKYWVEKFDAASGEWSNQAPSPLDDHWPVPYGYVKYRGQFESQGGDQLFIDLFTADGIQAFVNGKSIEKPKKPSKSLSIDLAGKSQPGSNLLEISYEAFGAANFGPEIQELKGIKSVRVGTSQPSTAISPLPMQRFSPAMHGRELNQDYSGSPWQAVQLGSAAPSEALTPAFTWLQAEFPLSSAPEWFAPWKVAIDSDRDALLYLNRKFVGRFSTLGPQKEFYLPEPYLFLDGKQNNVLTVLLAYTANPQHLRQLQVLPYREFATRKTEIELHWEI
jgi:Glycosyl hydrolases family 35/Beta-galactosidase, domain 2